MNVIQLASKWLSTFKEKLDNENMITDSLSDEEIARSPIP